ncbi:hypothetical protein AT1219_70110 [Vibrio alginolyticus]
MSEKGAFAPLFVLSNIPIPLHYMSFYFGLKALYPNSFNRVRITMNAWLSVIAHEVILV